MKPELQRIRIAEACGWTEVFESGCGQAGDQFDLRGRNPKWMGIKSRVLVPQYLSDLNAMHEAEKVLTETQTVLYRSTLAVLCGGTKSDDDGLFADLGYAISATAAQRAEAFLRTLNLWEDEQP